MLRLILLGRIIEAGGARAAVVGVVISRRAPSQETARREARTADVGRGLGADLEVVAIVVEEDPDSGTKGGGVKYLTLTRTSSSLRR